MALVLAAGVGAIGILSSAANAFTTAVVRRIAISKKKKAFSWSTDDDDDRRRVCTVRWYKRRIFGFSNHWVLTFDWGDYEATYEADEVGGYLIPRWKTGGPELGPLGSGTRYKWKQGKTFQVICSPKEVNANALKVPFNGAKYILTKINCHVWVKCLARALGIRHFALNAIEEMLIPNPIAMVADGLNKVGVFSKSM